LSEQETATTFSQNAPKAHMLWWVRLCDILWKSIAFLGTTLILGVVASVLATWLTTSRGILPANTPLSQLFAKWTIALPIGGFLVLLALLIYKLSRWPASETISLSRVQQNRIHTLRRLRRIYNEVLTHALQGVVWLDLGLAQRPDAIQNAATLLLRLAHRPEKLLPPGTSIKEVFEDAAHELLILGEPGSGKSTLLLQLAQQLVVQAEQDNAQPLPILLPLSSWAVKQAPLEDWLTDQVVLLYEVPRRIASYWVEESRLLPLLDGIDEMEETARPACIEAINVYRHAHPGPFVVCARTAEYDKAAKYHHLSLQNAVVVQPLSYEQMDNYLTNADTTLEALRRVLEKNTELRELARTPLMLSVLTLTYQGVAVRDLSKGAVELQRQVWSDYVKRMVQYKGDVRHYSLSITTIWLSRLARQMRKHNQTIFSLEFLQADWLPERRKIFYPWSIMLVVGIVVGIVSGLVVGIVSGLVVGIVSGLVVGIVSGLVSGLAVGPLAGLLTEMDVWTDVGLRVGLVAWLVAWLIVGLAVGLRVGVLTAIAVEQVIGLLAKSVIWLVVGFFSGLLTGLVVGFFSGLLTGLVVGFFSGLLTKLVVGPFTVMQHITLRFWLWQTGTFPWQAQRFLDDAVARTFLQRVGGGYSFIHRMLLDYFADLDS
jgi:NACHT domain